MRLRICYAVFVLGCHIALFVISPLVSSIHAQTTNITSSGLKTIVEQSGNTINITGGSRPFLANEFTPGPNVFHSFGRFDLAAGDIANFVRPDALATTVISRVTGGVTSNINGTLQALGWSNFYFVNPSGVVFGPSATLNMPNASVYFSTAHNLNFANEAVFNTRSGESISGLSIFPISSFGFTTGAAVAPITISGSNLSVASGKTLAAIGGPITIDGAKLTAPNGKVQVASVSNAVGYGGEVTADSLQLFDISEGSITMSPGSSFAALDAGPNGTVQTVPAPTSIQTTAESQIIIQPNLTKPSLIKVVTAPVLNSISPKLTVEEGETQTITISLNKPAETTEFVTVSNSNAAAATTDPPPGRIRFDPGEQTQTVKVTGVKQGSTQLSATLRGVARTAAVTVLQRQGISENLTQTVELGVSGTLIITLNRTSSTPTEITLNNLTPGVATLNTTKVTISPEQTTSPPIEVKSVTVGTATVRAILGNASVEKSMQVTPMSIASLSGVSILEGQSGTATVTLPRVAPSDVTVTLTTSNSKVATVETSVTVPQGKTSAPVTVFGVTEGTVQLRAQSGDSTQTAAVVVNASPPPPLTSAVTVPLSNPDIAGASQTIELAAAAQYPRAIAAPQVPVTVPRLLADRCAGSKDGQFSSFAQLDRDAAPPQPGRYLSSPSILEQDLLSMGRSSTPEISFSIGPPRVLSVSPGATLLAMDACGR
jgi:filamentous hemagglutinin family protein